MRLAQSVLVISAHHYLGHFEGCSPHISVPHFFCHSERNEVEPKSLRFVTLASGWETSHAKCAFLCGLGPWI